jgi:hypothetical protein
MDKRNIKNEFREVLQDFATKIKILKIFCDGLTPGYGDALIEAMQEEMEKLKTKAPAAPKVAKAMLSQPMAGKTDEEIAATREKAIIALQERGYEVVNTLFTDEWCSENMSLCHAAYFCKGWGKARGCKIEHDAAVAYGLDIIYEE